MVYHASLWHQFVNMVRNLKARRSPWGSHVALWPTSHQSGKTRAFSVFETSHLQGLSRQSQKAGSNPPQRLQTFAIENILIELVLVLENNQFMLKINMYIGPLMVIIIY